jgi:GNAT superfamily N-acetyltransferase
LQLVRGSNEDIAFVVATERLPGFEQLVGRWSDAQHRSALADGRHAYFIARFESEAIGFAIVRDWASAERVAHIKRVVVSHPGRGHGKALLVQLVQIISRILMHIEFGSVCSRKIPALVAPMRLLASRPRASHGAVRSSAVGTGMKW